MENRTILALIIVAIVAVYFMGGFPITEDQREIPCENYDECLRIAEEHGLDKTVISCTGEAPDRTCKVIITK